MTSELPNSKIRKFLNYGLVILLLSVLTFLAIRPSFNLALSGDDWLLHYTIRNAFDIGNSNYFNPLTYLCTYCPHYFFLSIIKFFWGINPFYHYLISYFTRVIAALSIFLLVNKLTKKRSLALLAGIFFSVNYLGIETTDWVFNLNHYLGIAVVCIFFISYWKAQNIEKIKYLIVSALLFAGALIISPPRMHGLFPLVLFSELILFLIKGKSFSFKKGFVRITVIFITYGFIFSWLGKIIKFVRDTGLHFDTGGVINGYGTPQWNFQRVTDGLSIAQTMLANGQSDFIINPIATLGNYILPDRLWGIFPHVVPIVLLFTLISILILKLYGIKRRVLVFYTVSLVMWGFFIYMLWKVNPNTFLISRVAFSLIGGFSIFFTTILFFLIKKDLPVIAYLFAVAFGWMNTFSFFPQLLEPYGIIFTWGRYSIQQGAGLTIWMSIVIYLAVKALKEKKLYSFLGIPYILAIAFFVMHLTFTNNYLQHVGTYRNVELDRKFWTKITTDVPKIDQNSLSIFFLVSHPNAYEAAEAFRFGFYGRPAMFYNFTGDELLNPLTIFNDYQALLSSAYDGTYFTKKLGRAKEKIALGNIYAFYFDENNQLSNITEIVRQKLIEEMEALNKGSLILPQ